MRTVELPVTQEHVESLIAITQYHRMPNTTVTICCLTLKNGYNVVGHSACVDPEMYDSEVGHRIAFENAVQEIWKLEGYIACEQRYELDP